MYVLSYPSKLLNLFCCVGLAMTFWGIEVLVSASVRPYPKEIRVAL